MIWSAQGTMALCLMLAMVTLAGTAAADWSGEVEVGPQEVRADSSYQCTVNVTNTGSAPLHVTEIVYSLAWPWSAPHPSRENFTVFRGDAVILPGEYRIFTADVNTADFAGITNTTTAVTGHAEGEASSVRTFASNTWIRGTDQGSDAESDTENDILLAICALFALVVLAALLWDIHSKKRSRSRW